MKAILSRFDPNALTAETAQAIHEAFREAGLRGGPAMSDTIKAAGFDPDKLRDLAPSPEPGNDGNERPSAGREQARGADDRFSQGGRQSALATRAAW